MVLPKRRRHSQCGGGRAGLIGGFPSGAEGAAEKGLVGVLRIEGMDLTRKFSLIYHKNKFLSPPMRGFMSVCEAYDSK